MRNCLYTVFITSFFYGVIFLQKQKQVDRDQKLWRNLQVQVTQIESEYPRLSNFLSPEREGRMTAKIHWGEVDRAKAELIELIKNDIKEGGDIGSALRGRLHKVLNSLKGLTDRESFEALTQALEESKGSNHSFFYMTFCIMAAESAPLKYIEKWKEMGEGFFVEPQMFDSVVMGALRQNSEVAIEWAGRHKNDGIYHYFSKAIEEEVVIQEVINLFETDPEEAVEKVVSEDFDAAVGTMVRLRAALMKDPETIIEAVRNFSDKEGKDQWAFFLYSTVDGSEGVKGFTTLADQIFSETESEARNRTLADGGMLAHVRTVEDANLALEIIKKSGSGRGSIISGYNAQEAAVSGLVSEWMKVDFNGAGLWLNQLPDSRNRDVGVKTFAFKILDLDPEAAMTWAGSLSDPLESIALQKEVFGKWKQGFPEEAEEWGKVNAVPDDWKKAE